MKADESQVAGHIIVAASFVAEPIEDSLEYWLGELGVTRSITFAPYHQVLQQLLDPNSPLSNNQHGHNIVLIRLEDWQRDRPAAPFDPALFERTANELIAALKAAGARGLSQLVVFCPPSPQLRQQASVFTLLEQLETAVAAQLDNIPGIEVVTRANLELAYPVTQYHDEHADKIAHIPFTAQAFAALGTLIVRRLHASRNAHRKVIVIDADQTLWDGVCGEDGALGIKLGAARIELQRFMLEQFEAGQLLCLCSANNEADVAAVFEMRQEMPLRRNHFAAWRVNWQPKSENIKAIARELSVGLESIVFVDDDELVCAEVRANCPEVTTLHLPSPVESIPKFLRHSWFFDRTRITPESAARSALYRDHAQRENLREQAPSLAAFIAGLEIKVEIESPTAADLVRVAELTQRTNQFNFSSIRRSDSQLARLLGPNQLECRVVRVSDRLGDYGLVGALIFQARADALVVDTFLLSCRALGRGVEFQMLSALGDIALQRGLDKVLLNYVPNARNQPIATFLRAVEQEVQYEPDSDITGQAVQICSEHARAARFGSRSPRSDSMTTQNPGGRERPIQASTNARALASPADKSAWYREIALHCDDAAKIQHKIAARTHQRAALATAYIAPRNLTEQKLAAIWSEYLGIEGIGVDDNFFDLGGHSLTAMRILSRIGENFGLFMSPRNLFQDNLTIAHLANVLAEHQKHQGDLKGSESTRHPADSQAP